MKINMGTTQVGMPGFSGMGPAAWDRDTQKMSMHPPLPGHIEYVEEESHRHHPEHHIVHRDNPENRHENILISEIPPKYLKQLLTGKVYLKRLPAGRSPTATKRSRRAADEQADSSNRDTEPARHHFRIATSRLAGGRS